MAFRETVVQADEPVSTAPGISAKTGESDGGGLQGRTLRLPPPWKDLPGLHRSEHGRYRLVSPASGIALTLRCFPLPAAIVSVLESSAVVAEVADLALGKLHQRRHWLDHAPLASGHPGDSGESLELPAPPGDGESYDCFVEARSQRHFWASLVSALNEAADEQGSANSGALLDSCFTSLTEGLGLGDKSQEQMEALFKADPSVLRTVLGRVLSIGPRNVMTCMLLLAPYARIDVVPSGIQSGTHSFDSHPGDDQLHSQAHHDRCRCEAGHGQQAHARRPNTSTSASAEPTPSFPVSDATEASEAATATLLGQEQTFRALWSRLHSLVASAGFQMAVSAGPLMLEPLHGVGFCVEAVELSAATAASMLSDRECAHPNAMFTSSMDSSHASRNIAARSLLRSELVQGQGQVGGDASGPAGAVSSGHLISEVRDALHLSMLSHAVRVVEPVYACDLQCDSAQLGNLYSVLHQRRGSVVNEDIIEGTSLFLLTAHLPVEASFGFAQQLLKRTSGLGTTPQLRLSHWSTLELDPFWRPTTAEEREEFGEHAAAPPPSYTPLSSSASAAPSASSQAALPAGAKQQRQAHNHIHGNLARGIIDGVRKRKGLAVEEKVVNFAEKQRTLNKKK